MAAKCSWCGKTANWLSGDKAACPDHLKECLDEYNAHVVEVKAKERKQKKQKTT